MNDINSLTHTTWNCKYHIVFAPKYRRVDTTGKNAQKIQKYIKRQLDEDEVGEQLTMDNF